MFASGLMAQPLDSRANGTPKSILPTQPVKVPASIATQKHTPDAAKIILAGNPKLEIDATSKQAPTSILPDTDIIVLPSCDSTGDEDVECYTEYKDHMALYFTDFIEPESLNRFQRIFIQYFGSKPVRINLTSLGGSFSDADIDKVVASFKAMAWTQRLQHGVPLVVNISGICSSLCSLITTVLTNRFPTYLVRVVTLDSTTFGFHAPQDAYENEDGEIEVEPIQDKKRREAMIQEEITAYLNAGVDLKWINKNIKLFSRDVNKGIPARVLCKARTMIIPPESCYENVGELDKMISRILTTR